MGDEIEYWLEIKNARSEKLKEIYAGLLSTTRLKNRQTTGPFSWAGLEIVKSPARLDKYQGSASRWDLRDDDLCALSAKYPSVLFVLYGKGVGDEDRWIAYYRRGKVQFEIAKTDIRYAKYNSRRLKPVAMRQSVRS